MNIDKIFIALLLPLCVIMTFHIIKRSNYQENRKMSDENFIVFIPKMVAIIGLIGSLLALVVFIIFVFFSEQKLHWIFYFVFSTMFGMGVYLVLKTLRFKVIVNKNMIEVTPTFSKTYSFTFEDIIFAERQTKNNKTNSERIVLKTKNRKKLIVENTEISYERLLCRIKIEVDSNKLVGF